MSLFKRTSWRAIALLAVFSLLLAACGDDDEETTGGTESTEAGATATIGFVGALTGDNANLGINIRDGMRVAIEEENAKGGTRVTMKEFDTAGDPAQASTVKDRFIGDESVIGIVGPAFSGETRAVIPDLANAQLVMVSPSATNKDLPNLVPNNPTFHRVIGDDLLQSFGIGRYLAEVEKPASVAYVHDNSEYGKALTLDTEKEASSRGVRRAGEIFTVDPKAQDFSAVVNRVRSANPDLIFYGGYYTEAGRLRKQLFDNGVRVRFLSGDGSLDAGFVTAAGAPAAEGAQMTCACRLATEDAGGKLGEFARAYRQLNNAAPGTYSTEGYDAANILINGIKAGKTDRRALLDHVENLGTYEGVGKSVSFEPNGNIRATGVFVYEVKGGKLNSLGTTEELSR